MAIALLVLLMHVAHGTMTIVPSAFKHNMINDTFHLDASLLKASDKRSHQIMKCGSTCPLWARTFDAGHESVVLDSLPGLQIVGTLQTRICAHALKSSLCMISNISAAICLRRSGPSIEYIQEYDAFLSQ
jgi:hypothetical protein